MPKTPTLLLPMLPMQIQQYAKSLHPNHDGWFLGGMILGSPNAIHT
jgi:hypothetical protein